MGNKNLKFIVIDRSAAGELVSERSFQSIEFPAGRSIVENLKGVQHALQGFKAFTPVIIETGLFFLSKQSEINDILVIDLVEAPVFAKRTDSDILYLFQKIIRFAIKRWERMAFTMAERTLPNSTKGLLFPYPFSSQTPFRVTFELAPDQRRREKRAKGEELLLYKCGTEEGRGGAEEASTTIFRKAIEALPEAQALAMAHPPNSVDSNGVSSVLAVTRLSTGGDLINLGEAKFDEWMPFLSDAQREFVTSAITSPHRIEGPAGTGKTLSLVLKCISALRVAKKNGAPFKALFVAHSEATRRNIERLFEPEIASGTISTDGAMAAQHVHICTLHTFCAKILNTEISEAEFLDRDAFESKQAQLLYTLEALQESLKNELPTHRNFMSSEFVTFLEREDIWVVAEMLQHEISVKIKGRADEDESKYRKLPRLRYGLPVENEGDRVFVFLAFRNYRKRLEQAGQFDTDDIILSTLGQLNTPIWRRRRTREGFDAIFIDETHLFNLNELSVFHRLTRSEETYPIVYSADLSQSLGDRGWNDESFDSAMGISGGSQTGNQPTIFKSIFRCSPDIVSLAFSVTSSGATLFTNFQDPVAAANSTFTHDEERKCGRPIYWMCSTDEQMFKKTFARVDEIAAEIGCVKADIVVIAFGDMLFTELERLARNLNKPVEVIKHRGDFEVVQRARQGGRFILTTPDYVGGLEFSAAILIGVDKDRVPPRPTEGCADSQNFLSYASHQRLYVAITRARFRVEILGLETRGHSSLLSCAISNNLIDITTRA